ncbi:MAG TPA: class I SAM-dependent methyltransferase [Acidimicrobiia bacterium]|nr:class I SAM-dependent methyltransferase [Acidimicrobiia bacterium]
MAGGTEGADYTRRLEAAESSRWKRLLNVRAPYRWNLDRLGLGRTLDIGCGIGRNLVDLDPGSVGVDHNEQSVAAARSRGCDAMTPDEFAGTDPGSFDSLLFAHVLEHMPIVDAQGLVDRYLPYLGTDGRVVIIVPQEAGFRSDPTHVDFVGVPEIEAIADSLGLSVVRSYSFPFPRSLGRWFRYNETVVIAERPRHGDAGL